MTQSNTPNGHGDRANPNDEGRGRRVRSLSPTSPPEGESDKVSLRDAHVKVSVCIPTYNTAEYLGQAIESVLEQNYPDFEIVIVDNCSTDQTDALVSTMLKAGNGNIRFFKNETNIGLVGNLNRCLDHATGAYVKFLCADDLLLPGCLQQMAAGLDSHQSVKLVSSSRLLIDEHGNHLGAREYAAGDTIVPGHQAITRCLFGGNYIGEPTAVMFRKNDLKGYFREDMPQLSDMEMWFKLLEQGDLLNLAKPLCAIRSHAAQMTHANVRSSRIVEDNIKIFDIYSPKPYLKTTLLLSLRHKLLMTYRVWKSRKYLLDGEKKMVLSRYASRWAYPLMPVVWLMLELKKRLAG
ncbi:MAG: glycosyltransferase family A protein [Gallionellaceae bacterium]|nr:glycosyltransferase family A protein [Gallionellaceae bacterium]